jgi:hypothetical protein
MGGGGGNTLEGDRVKSNLKEEARTTSSCLKGLWLTLELYPQTWASSSLGALRLRFPNFLLHSPHLHTLCCQKALPQSCLQLLLWFQPSFHHILCLIVTGSTLLWLSSMQGK